MCVAQAQHKSDPGTRLLEEPRYFSEAFLIFPAHIIVMHTIHQGDPMPIHILTRSKLLATLAFLTVLIAVSATPVIANDHATLDVDVFNFGFGSSSVTINVGDEIQWMNISGFHNVSSTDGTTFRCGSGGCDQTGGNGAPGNAPWTASFTFDTPGVYDYVCDIHSSMAGTITVIPTTAVTLLQASVPMHTLTPLVLVGSVILLSAMTIWSAHRRFG